MKIFIATGNLHKKQEFQKIFSDYEIFIPKDLGIDFDPVENGTTFAANSLIKAQELYKLVNAPVLADDSGICVESINDRPGIYSARYAGKDYVTGNDSKLSSFERNKLLIEETNETLKKNGKDIYTPENRLCRFVCALTFYYGKDKYITIQDTIEGTLVDSLDEAKGSGGFGYDPVVYLPEYKKTVAELSEDEKNNVSHRGKACKKLLDFLKQNNSF